MKTILAVTVGSSLAPIATAIQDYQPEYICFIASGGKTGTRILVDGSGNPCCKDEKPAPCLATQLALEPSSYRIVEVADPDMLPDIYIVCLQELVKLRAEFPDARHIADYTGGTKTFGAALVLAALQDDWELSLVKGDRADRKQVTDGTQMAVVINSWDVRARQRFEEARTLFNDFAYASAERLLTKLMQHAPVSPEMDHAVRSVVALCRGLDAWDRFDHKQAEKILFRTKDAIEPQWIFLRRMNGQAAKAGYELVLDLLRNAERRAARGRFDDAVARLYRALELFAQIRLRNLMPSLDSGDLKLELLPKELRPRYEQRAAAAKLSGRSEKIQLGLMEDYLLLAALGDPLGTVFASWEQKLRTGLEKRNNSILAHGLSPISGADYEAVSKTFIAFMSEGFAALGFPAEAPQFPCLDGEKICQRG